MDFEQLKTFITLAKSKNFTRTAEELNVVQSTVTARIKLLEEEIGESLFIRKTRYVEITEAGKTFLTYAMKTLEIMDEGIKTTRLQTNFDSNLVIGGMNSLWDTPIFEQIHAYQSNNPRTAIRLITGHSSDIIEKIYDGLIDIGFVYNPPHSSSFHVITIREEDICLVGAPTLAKRVGIMESDSLKEIPFIHYDWGTEFSEWFESEVGKHETMRYRVDHTGIAMRLIINGEGIGFMLESIVNHCAKELIMHIPLKSKTTKPKRKVYMVCSKSRKERYHSFLQYMIELNCNSSVNK